MSSASTKLSISSIRVDGGTQTRERVDLATVESYADAMQSGAKFPKPVVFYDGETYWLADGFHRVAAAKSIGVDILDCDVKQGDRRAAILHSVGANATNGLRRTNADKRRAVATLLGDDEWSSKSDRWVAERCGVHHELVARMRGGSTGGKRQLDVRTGQDGKTRKMPERHPAAPPESANDEDDDQDVPGEVFEGEEPAVAREQERTGWGSFDVASHVFKIISACKDAETRLTDLCGQSDPRFAAEVRQRTQDSLLRLMRAIDSLLPPDGRRAESNRKTFELVTGGKSK